MEVMEETVMMVHKEKMRILMNTQRDNSQEIED